MTDYSDGKWHGWNGGECPVDPCCMVEAVWHDPQRESAGMTGPRRAKEDDHMGPTLAWSHVVKFRVVAPPKPREFWLRFDMNGNPPVVYDTHTEPITVGGFVVHVREVTTETN